MRYCFENCVLDTQQHVLLRNGVLVEVEPQVFDLLELLVRHAGDLVTKDQIIDAIWGGRIVSESAVSARIYAARVAVGDSGKAQAIIKTVTRRGLQFVADVSVDGAAVVAETDQKQRVKYARSVDGTRIAYAVSGQGPEIVRAGHFLTHLEKDWGSVVWRPYLDALGRDHTLVRYDQRGTGMSDRLLGDMDLDRYVEDLRAVVEAAGVTRFPLVGWSQGVPVAVRFAARYPERVACLVLYGGYAKGRALRSDAPKPEQNDAMLAMIKEGWGKPDSAFMGAFTSLFCPEGTKEQLADLVDMQLASASGEAAMVLRKAIDRFVVTEDLEAVAAPTLVIHSHNDSVHPLAQGQLLASRIEDAELLVVQSNNHIPVPGDPAWTEIMEATLAFIARYDEDDGNAARP